MNNILMILAGVSLSHLLIGFLVIVCILAAIYGLMYLIETWISPIPQPVKLVLAIILLIAIIIWALGALGGGGFNVP